MYLQPNYKHGKRDGDESIFIIYLEEEWPKHSINNFMKSSYATEQIFSIIRIDIKILQTLQDVFNIF
jgi:hypothetical protein